MPLVCMTINFKVKLLHKCIQLYYCAINTLYNSRKSIGSCLSCGRPILCFMAVLGWTLND